jgi:hypothetical protein
MIPKNPEAEGNESEPAEQCHYEDTVSKAVWSSRTKR